MPRAAGSKGLPVPRLPGPFVPYGPPGETVVGDAANGHPPSERMQADEQGSSEQDQGRPRGGRRRTGFDPLVDAADITVRNIAGDVTLTGTVPSYPQYLEAAAAARRVAGVTGVHNHLGGAAPEGDYRDDVKLATAANNALAANVTVPDSVEATAEDGNIILTGTVSYGTELSAAEAAVAAWPGSVASATISRSATPSTRLRSTCTSSRRWTAPRWSPTTAT